MAGVEESRGSERDSAAALIAGIGVSSVRRVANAARRQIGAVKQEVGGYVQAAGEVSLRVGEAVLTAGDSVEARWDQRRETELAERQAEEEHYQRVGAAEVKRQDEVDTALGGAEGMQRRFQDSMDRMAGAVQHAENVAASLPNDQKPGDKGLDTAARPPASAGVDVNAGQVAMKGVAPIATRVEEADKGIYYPPAAPSPRFVARTETVQHNVANDARATGLIRTGQMAVRQGIRQFPNVSAAKSPAPAAAAHASPGGTAVNSVEAAAAGPAPVNSTSKSLDDKGTEAARFGWDAPVPREAPAVDRSNPWTEGTVTVTRSAAPGQAPQVSVSLDKGRGLG